MIPRRVMGIETEYGLTCASTQGGTPPLDPEEAAQLLFQPVIEMGRSTNTFLGNGARLYLDVGSHPEYASAECDSIDDLLANDRAGDLLFADLAAQANDELVKRGIPGASICSATIWTRRAIPSAATRTIWCAGVPITAPVSPRCCPIS